MRPVDRGSTPASWPPVRASLADYRRTTGTCFLQDIHEDPGLAGIGRGTVQKLRAIALGYRAAAGKTWSLAAWPKQHGQDARDTHGRSRRCYGRVRIRARRFQNRTVRLAWGTQETRQRTLWASRAVRGKPRLARCLHRNPAQRYGSEKPMGAFRHNARCGFCMPARNPALPVNGRHFLEWRRRFTRHSTIPLFQHSLGVMP
jgi:hypothetical protein